MHTLYYLIAPLLYNEDTLISPNNSNEKLSKQSIKVTTRTNFHPLRSWPTNQKQSPNLIANYGANYMLSGQVNQMPSLLSTQARYTHTFWVGQDISDTKRHRSD
ncbi:hypothetical protein AVEN_95267-1 [Araneus ventricosus]|uniref:Uncharacterized protein n=1 Tax=Araneus ventricosus TaxID=182803 RepID=A0A4Y2DIH5_ARAVE|nr:hypothetical protein AVEN_95267-1 [Araneus ventricosus]